MAPLRFFLANNASHFCNSYPIIRPHLNFIGDEVEFLVVYEDQTDLNGELL